MRTICWILGCKHSYDVYNDNVYCDRCRHIDKFIFRGNCLQRLLLRLSGLKGLD